MQNVCSNTNIQYIEGQHTIKTELNHTQLFDGRQNNCLTRTKSFTLTLRVNLKILDFLVWAWSSGVSSPWIEIKLLCVAKSKMSSRDSLQPPTLWSGIENACSHNRDFFLMIHSETSNTTITYIQYRFVVPMTWELSPMLHLYYMHYIWFPKLFFPLALFASPWRAKKAAGVKRYDKPTSAFSILCWLFGCVWERATIALHCIDATQNSSLQW